MDGLKRTFQRLGSRTNLSSNNTDNSSPPPPVPISPPQINLPHVDTHLNMHQINGLFEDGSLAAETLRDPQGSPPSQSNPPNHNNPNGSPMSPADEAPTEWSAVGHAATGKSGRVIHNLQEEIARLRRECSVYKSRAEETQRSNETLKTQTQNMSERLRNLEQVNETNLNSIARKDRKIEDLRAEISHEREKRKDAEADAGKANDMMRDEREDHHEKQAKASEESKYYQTQYEVLASATKRDKSDLNRRVKGLFDELHTLKDAYEKHILAKEHLEVIADQKNREIEGLKEIHDKLVEKHLEYKEFKDNEFRDTLQSAKDNNGKIDGALASIREADTELRWALRLHNTREQEDQKEEKEEENE